MPYYRACIIALGMLLVFNACKKITDKDEAPKPPSLTITTRLPDSLSTNSCVSGGRIESDGTLSVYGRGVCWSMNRTTADLNTKIKNRADTGSFSSLVYGLQPNTTYYLRAYVITMAADTLYGQEHSFTTPSRDAALSLGQYYAGGIIFYLDNSKEHGLVCAPFDLGGATWGCEMKDISGTSLAIGTGAQNTKAIISACPEVGYIAKICDSIVLNSYDDWFMPSKDELVLMYENVHSKGKGNFGTVYHSSTNYDGNSAWAMQFQGGRGTPYNLWKGGHTAIRPVRAF